MQSHTLIIFSFLLLLGNAPSSKALMIENEAAFSSTFFRGSARTKNHEDRVRQKGIRAFLNTTCGSDLDSDKCPHRGSGR